VRCMKEDLSKDLKALIDRDPTLIDFLRAMIFKREFHMILIYRLSHLIFKWKLPLVSSLIQRLNIIFFGIEISYKIHIAGGFRINHGIGTVIGDAKIDKDVIIFQNVTIGANYPELTRSMKIKGYPVIEQNVIIFPGAKIIGPITIGSNSIIGANAVVTSNVLPNSIVSGPQSVVIGIRSH
jgi:serine O-acetyltransferase